MTTKRSRLELERALLEGDATLSPDEQARISRWAEEDRAYRLRHPTLASSGVSMATPKARSSAWRWASYGVAFGAVLLAFSLSVSPPPADAPSTRMKGGSNVEMLVSTPGGPIPFDGQTLQPGDTLVFRYTSERRYLLLAGIERSGRPSVFQNRMIEPGQNQVISEGLQLDDYPDAERIFVFLSDAPLDEDHIAALLAERFATLDEGARARLDLGVLSIEAEQLSWLIRKASP